MSGQQTGAIVGGIVGAVVGFFAGGNVYAGYVIGSAIGGAIGGYIDPTVIKGPRLTDAMQQTVSDGVPIPWGFGTFPTAGNIIWAGRLIERKHEDDGKGSGQVQVTYTYHRSFAILICQGVRQPDGTYLPITGMLQVKRDGKVIYDVSPGVSMEQQAQNTKFLRDYQIYLGSEDQLPSSVIEAELGVGNAPAYPGSVYMVAENIDCTDLRGAISQYEFVVSVCGEVIDGSGSYLVVTGSAKTVGGPVFASALATESPNFVGLPPDSGANIPNAVVGYHGGVWAAVATDAVRYSTDNRTTWQEGVIDSGGQPISWLVGGNSGWIADHQDIPGIIYPYTAPLTPAEFTLRQPPAVVPDHNRCHAFTGGYYYRSYTRTLYRSSDMLGDWEQIFDVESSGDPNSTAIQIFMDVLEFGGHLYATVGQHFSEANRRWQIRRSMDGGVTWPDILVDEPNNGHAPMMLCSGNGRIVAYCFGGGVWTSENSFSSWVDVGIDGVSGVTPQTAEGGRRIAFGDGNFYVIGYGSSDGDKCVVSSDGLEWSSPITLPIHSVKSIAAASFEDPDFGIPVPDAPGFVISSDGQIIGSPGSVLTRCKPTLAEIVTEACLRSGLTVNDIDVSELTDEIDGYKVAVDTSGEAIIGSLMPGWFFDAVEKDDKIYFPKRGRDVVAELTIDDLCESDGDVIEETELQEVELLRRVHVQTIDPAAGYTVTTQTAERRTSTINAKGEQSIQISAVTDKDTQARIGDKRLKVGWAENRRFRTCIPYTRPDLTVTDVIGLTDAKGHRSRVRLMEMAEDSGRIEIKEAMLDRQSSYTSNVEGVVHEPPTDTAPGLIGPTFGVAMNLPSLRTQDNVPGVYIAASGYLSGWMGCTVLLSADGGVSYQQIAIFDQPSSMGILKAAATESSEPLEVFMRSGVLSSITDAQLAARQNAFAITTSGVSELGQFKTAVQDSSGAYELTETVRGALGTAAAAHSVGDPFVMVSTAKFIPLDASLADKALLLKFVSFGTSPDDAAPVEFVFHPLFTSVTIQNLTVSGEAITVDGNSIFVVTQNA